MEPLFQKIIGKTPEVREAVSKMLTDQFKEQNYGSPELKKILSQEVLKTNEQYQVIFSVNKYIDEILKKLGRKPIEILPNNIHLIKNFEGIKGTSEDVGGGFSPHGQMILIGERACKNNIIFTLTLTHEMVHAKGYNALNVTEDDQNLPINLGVYRSGLQIGARDSSKIYLVNLDEAFTEIIALNLLPKLLDTAALFEESKQQVLLKEKISKRTNPPKDMSEYTFVELDKNGNLVDYEMHGYPEQRKIVKILINKILDKNRSKFTNKKEVEDFIIKAKMTGHLVEFANIIDSSFGEGSFRRMAECDIDSHDPEPLKKIIDSFK